MQLGINTRLQIAKHTEAVAFCNSLLLTHTQISAVVPETQSSAATPPWLCSRPRWEWGALRLVRLMRIYNINKINMLYVIVFIGYFIYI